MATKEEILAASDRMVEVVEVKEWPGGTVRLMEMTAADRDEWETGLALARQSGQPRKHVRAELVARCLVDENGVRVFSDADIPALSQKSGQVLDRLWDVAGRMNGLTKKDVKEIEKN